MIEPIAGYTVPFQSDEMLSPPVRRRVNLEETLALFGFVRVSLIEHTEAVQTRVYESDTTCELARNLALLLGRGLENNGPYAAVADISYKCVAMDCQEWKKDQPKSEASPRFVVLQPELRLYEWKGSPSLNQKAVLRALPPTERIASKGFSYLYPPAFKTVRVIAEIIKDTTRRLAYSELGQDSVVVYLGRDTSGKVEMRFI